MDGTRHITSSYKPKHMAIENKKQCKRYARDLLYALHDAEESSFVFDKNVAYIFNDMAHRSIPGYCDIQRFTAYYTLQYLQFAHATRTEDSTDMLYGVLDIGTSLGTSLGSITQYADSAKMSLMHCIASACDNSVHMIERARDNLRESEKKWHSILYECVDIANARERIMLLRRYEKHNIELRVVILNFVLQFTPLEVRSAILSDVWETMSPQSVLIVGEKLHANDECSQRVWDTMHKNFKRSMGYSDKEIESKRRALVGVLQPMRESVLTCLLYNLPNSVVNVFFTWGAFHGYVVRKD